MKRRFKFVTLPGLITLSFLTAFAQDQFIDVAEQVGVTNTDVGSGVAWADFNNDGMLDFYVSTPGANYIYQNQGLGFSRGPDGLVDFRNSSACTWADYDNDGWLDLFVANAGENGLFHRIGEHYFDVARSLRVNEVGYQ